MRMKRFLGMLTGLVAVAATSALGEGKLATDEKPVSYYT